MNTEKQNDLTKYIPHELVDPRVKTITLGPLKAILKQKETDYQNTIKELKEEISRLTKELEDSNNKLASIKSYIDLKNYISVLCPQRTKKLTIIQCFENMKQSQCKGCLDRDAVLSKLGARPR
jgi:hypothetical protein